MRQAAGACSVPFVVDNQGKIPAFNERGCKVSQQNHILNQLSLLLRLRNSNVKAREWRVEVHVGRILTKSIDILANSIFK